MKRDARNADLTNNHIIQQRLQGTTEAVLAKILKSKTVCCDVRRQHAVPIGYPSIPLKKCDFR